MRNRVVVRRGLMVIALVVSFVAGGAIARAADPRLDEALLSLAKAEALVQASEDDSDNPPHVHQEFQRHVNRALTLIERAMDQIQQAKDAVDNP